MRTVVVLQGMAALTLVGSALSPLARAQPTLDDRSVVSGDSAYVLLPPELACGQSVVEAKWSSDGRYVLSLCRAERVSPSLARTRALKRDPGDPPGDLSLVVWGPETHRPQEVWRRPIGRARVERFEWLPASDRAFAVIVEEPTRPGAQPRREVLWVRAGAGSARIVADIPFDQIALPPGTPPNGASVEASPAQPLAVIRRWTRRDRTVQRTDGSTRTMVEIEDALTPIRADGSLGPPVSVPGAGFATWGGGGRTCYLTHTEWPADPQARPVTVYFEFDPSTGQVRRLPGEPPDFYSSLRPSCPPGQEPDPEVAAEEAVKHLPVRLASSPAAVKEGVVAAGLRPLWLEAAGQVERPRALVCADAHWSRIAPTGEAALYLSQGAAWVRPIMRVGLTEYAAMRREGARRQAVADASVLSTALLNMVGSGEYYPRDDQLRDWLGPYLKSAQGLLDRLVYTHGPGVFLPPDVAATTVLGYVPGPGGRAVIYADGRAAWKDD